MKIYTCHTPSHEILYRRHFLPSLPAELVNVSFPLEPAGASDFGSPGFLQSIGAKMRLVIDSIEANRGDAILWSDVDIVFRRSPLGFLRELLEMHPEVDIWFQSEARDPGGDVNAGFVLMRCNDAVKALYEAANAMMNASGQCNDQDALNRLLRSDAAPNWAYLPGGFFARSHGWPPRRDIFLYHANCTVGDDGVGQKIRQFRELETFWRYGWPYVQYRRYRGKIEKLGRKANARLQRWSGRDRTG